MEGPGSSDVWVVIGRFLPVTALCRCMCASKNWFYHFVTDRMWACQRDRICAVCPELVPVFNSHAGLEADGAHVATHSQKRNSNKKRKKSAWVMPRRGYWHLFSRLSCGGQSESIMECLKHQLNIGNPLYKCFASVMARMCLPCPGAVQFKNFEDVRLPGGRSRHMYRIVFTANGFLIAACIDFGKPWFSWKCKDNEKDTWERVRTDAFYGYLRWRNGFLYNLWNTAESQDGAFARFLK